MPCNARLAATDQPAIEHQLADAGIVAAVLRLVADPQHLTVGHPDEARALHLEEEELDRIDGIAENPRLAAERALLNHRAVIIGNEGAALDAATDLLALQRFRKLAQVDVDQVTGPGINRGISRLERARTGDFRNVIAGGERLSVADLHRFEPAGEEGAGVATARRGVTGRFPIRPAGQARGIGTADKRGAADTEGGERARGGIVGDRQG